MRVSTSKSEAMVLCKKKHGVLPPNWDRVSAQSEAVMYLVVLFPSDGRMEWESDRWIDAAWLFWWRGRWAERQSFSNYQSIYVLTLTCDHELWVVTERMRSRIQVTEMPSPCSGVGLSLRDRVGRSDIRGELRVEPPLPLRRRELRRLQLLISTPPGRPPLQAIQLVGDPRVDPEHAGEIV